MCSVNMPQGTVFTHSKRIVLIAIVMMRSDYDNNMIICIIIKVSEADSTGVRGAY